MFNIFKKKNSNKLVAPIDGELTGIENVSDEVFSTKVMGDGFAIKPSSDLVVSPINGEVTSVFPTKHAISITTDNGLEVLLHLGIDTVELKGAPFEMLVEAGQHVQVGDQLVKMDREEISRSNKDDIVMLVLPGKNELSFDPAISNRMVNAGDEVTTIQ
ncbi:PTS glucose transporter subunit IIA [Companilactobacillus huachuanensis]|uniref:PTS glucose transporter subunit IIA n=1 Tax=Companilactobacillus huachuanensis TaxID=2559914 RepID=A0ABW1RNA5_9LACO|nr:PTS glucose transporter subunit IIA [Companilactobacillus huachuanensis]